MGLSPFSNSTSYQTNPLNPNPYSFKIKDIIKVNGFFISEINYPNCKNYEGNKILLTAWDPRGRTFIDPHFTEGNGLLARFQPTVQGWQLAKILARSI